MRIGQTGVQHKSGGPEMVIAEFDDLSVVTRWWDEKDRVFKRDKFSKEELRNMHGEELGL